MALPTVSAKDLHTVQLDSKLRKILHHRAAAANQREAAPILAADRAAFGAANRDYQAEAQSVKGAAHMVESTLAQALRGLKSSGLTGGYLRQARNELTSRQGDAAAAIPFLLSDAAQNRTAAIGDARQQLVSDKAQMLSGTAADFNSLLESKRNEGSSLLKEREDESGDAAPDVRGLNNAYKVALTAYKSALSEAGQETKSGAVIQPPKTDQEWAEFAEWTATKADAADQTDAYEAIKKLRARINQLLHQGKLPQPGVPGQGRE